MQRTKKPSAKTRKFQLAPPEALEARAMMASDVQNAQWVEHVYEDGLGRPADPGGLIYWSAQLNAGHSRTEVATSLLSSREAREFTVKTVFEEFLDRPIDPGAKKYYADLLDQGDTLDHVKSLILGSTEYYNKAGGTNDGFLQKLYQDVLHRDVDDVGKAYFKAWMAAGISRATVAHAVLKSFEADREVVEATFEHWLDREPDESGRFYYTAQLQVGVPDARVSIALAASEEYYSHV